MKNSVLSSGADSDVTKQPAAVFLQAFFMPTLTMPTQKPISRRMPTHRMNVWIADTPSSVEVMMDAPLMASIKLTKPKTPPRIVLASGPNTIAPTAIGTVKNDMYSGPTGTLPRPMSFITISTATRMASWVRYCTFIRLFFFG